DLFRIAERRFDKLAASGKPFNLDLLTIDNHPPHGRPSPGCPKYVANSNDVLQAVHCTDSLVGEFLDAISGNPAWKNTVVVVMSDHESLRNDAWPLYPSSYKRRPLLFVLNAGQGERPMRFYHMDIAPTVLHLMGVATNAEFLAGADRSEADAPGSPLVDSPQDVAVLRHALWARTQPVTLCTQGVLVGAAADGLMIGGHEVPLSNRGGRLAGLTADQTWALLIGPKDINETVIASAQLPAIETRREDERILLVRPDVEAPPARTFSIEWIGRGGARALLADVPRLENLQIESPDCAGLVDEVDRAVARGAVLDMREHFTARTAPLYPALPALVDFTSASARAFERELGWTLPAAWGTWSMGPLASLGFRLPSSHCHDMPVRFVVRPYLTASRPRLAVKISSNGRAVAAWQFDGDASTRTVETSIVTPDPECRVDLRFQFERPDAAPPPYPHGEDPRPLQLDFLRMNAVTWASAPK
ncbi:MAG TPA: sulfatase-like hydrolase/transferase, partial [Rhodanobacteraceae bacterium]|nr:sulfatase-like hydrolase/transferase [Rhodanobacteraceae bacterium]